MRYWMAVAAGIALTVAACGGGYGSSSTPTTPTSPSGPSGSTINIVGNLGSQSFSPNPASPPSGNSVAWRNSDSVSHRIVANDGSFDTGVITPGATSTAMALSSDGTNYHCAIHPGMIGAISASNGTPPPCQGAYCSSDR